LKLGVTCSFCLGREKLKKSLLNYNFSKEPFEVDACGLFREYLY
jgi:hypothetical protein